MVFGTKGFVHASLPTYLRSLGVFWWRCESNKWTDAVLLRMLQQYMIPAIW